MAESATLPPVLTQLKWLLHAVSCLDTCGREKEGEREGERERGKERGRERGREGEGGREREREGEREREREGGRGREGEIHVDKTNKKILLWSSLCK